MNTIVEQKELFEAVQLSGIFKDSKTFPDMVASRSLEQIVLAYENLKSSPEFDLRGFVNENFKSTIPDKETFVTSNTDNPSKHIDQLWEHLTKKTPAHNDDSTYIGLPNPFVVPGGRFQETYYWDSYFTMLGLLISKKEKLVLEMIENFGYLIDKYGFIPNGNRTYFLSRSQPPFFSLMVDLLDKFESSKKPNDFLNQMESEYLFWMSQRSIQMPDGEILNIYNDNQPSPRPESYIEDIELSHTSKQKPEDLFRNIRAACESGWDFSSRWLEKENDLSTINTTHILPVDLNCLLFHLEKRLSELHPTKSSEYLELAEKRHAAIQKYFWNKESSFFCDYDISKDQFRQNLTLAGVFPLYFNLATPEQATQVSMVLKTEFLKRGGLLTTTRHSGQQWDGPNGWAPLQWMAYCGLRNYGLLELAKQIKKNWTKQNETIFAQSGKFTEKYNIETSNAETGGGEYPNQDGFGWTNGVYLSFKNED
jgi:alpha,alpha-trehalase